MQKPLHLDDIYRKRWVEFHLENGVVEDSRKKNWRDVEWEKVDRIVVYMDRERHVFSSKKYSGFKGFLNFRWGGKRAMYEKKMVLNPATLKMEVFNQYLRHTPIHLWTVGYTDGKMCFLWDIDFFTGKKGSMYTAPVAELKNHIHPRIAEGIATNRRVYT